MTPRRGELGAAKGALCTRTQAWQPARRRASL
jgi:hypothetical protein